MAQTQDKLDRQCRVADRPAMLRRRASQGRRLLGLLGPGLISGAADIDPTTVATMAIIGATTVYALGWLAWLLFPMLALVLVIATRVGGASHRDLQQCLKDRYGPIPQWTVLLSILGVNILTISADAHAGAAALGLLVHHDNFWFVILIVGVALAMLLWGTTAQVQHVLKYILLCLLAYLIAAVLARPDWGLVFKGVFAPHMSLNTNYISGALAMLGTTITAYVYVWQTIEVAEEQPSRRLLRYRHVEAAAAMFIAVVIFWFILVATGATLGVHHEQIGTAEQAAHALAPIAGPYACYVFGAGLLASALVALPVLMDTTGHVLAAQLGAPRGLSKPIAQAPIYYAAVSVSTVLAVLISAVGVSPIRLLFVASIIGGLATPIGLVALMVIGSDARVMGGNALRGGLRAAGWAITGLITLLSIVYLVQQITGG
ncbi:MAG TPA: divalent metal cation transporter [Streptosporangiaceae bacterium]|nr:divalent metal cation transporter [Streptosporangiaceae bacterium]